MSERAEWLQHPVTADTRKRIEAYILDASVELGKGRTVNADSMENTFAMTIDRVGFIAGLEFALSVMTGEDE